jgi:hypothetical protein
MQLPDLLSSVEQVHIGRTYKAVNGPNGRPALEEVSTKGRPRTLEGEQLEAARALRRCAVPYRKIAETLEVSLGAVTTALGVRYAD